MKRIHLILSGLSLTIILLSLNRLTNFTQGYLQPFEFLRWLDFNAMLPIPLISVVLYYLLKKEIEYETPIKKTRLYLVLSVLLVSGIYFFGAGSGDHEVTNYLNFRFCDYGKVESSLCNIIGYNDDQFSHYIYYLGFILMNVALMGIEYLLPRKTEMKRKDQILITVNALFIALGIFANTAFEEAALDLVIFGSVMLLSLFMLTKNPLKKLPVTFYFAVSYTVGVFGAVVYKLLA